MTFNFIIHTLKYNIVKAGNGLGDEVVIVWYNYILQDVGKDISKTTGAMRNPMSGIN